MNQIVQRHGARVFLRFLTDFLIFVTAFVIGMRLRFGAEWWGALELYYPGLLTGALTFSCAAYILGLYAPPAATHSAFKRTAFVGLSLLIALAFMMGLFYVNFSARVGRGVMALGALTAFGMAVLHHLLLLQQVKNFRERVAVVIGSEGDETQARLLQAFAGRYLDFVGVIHYDGYRPNGEAARVLGPASRILEIAKHAGLDRVVCPNRVITDAAMCRPFCELRYSGVSVTPLIALFEEICQCVPVELVTPEWLLSASGSPHMLYIRKLKRGFDIAASVLGLLSFWPFLLAGMAVVKLTSRGPVFYKQRRVGRFGREFTLFKLRTMRVDAEAEGATWAQADDPRAVPGGRFLRRYRIDEIPQLWNVLRGEMSFVGPRPERPEFVQELTRLIPHYHERLLVQPGITGWAQVNYPYGATVEDARHKLEYDLYYAKNMSLFLDLFILLDTVRIILVGGLRHSTLKGRPRYQSDTDRLLKEQVASGVEPELEPAPSAQAR